MTPEREHQLKLDAIRVREGILTSTHGAKSGHPGGSLSAADLFTYLYDEVLDADPADPLKENRDRFVLSKGHTAPGLYAALAYRGFFPVDDLPTLRHIDSYLQGHPNMDAVPGVDMSTGSLGQGVSCAAGMALGLKHQGSAARVYTLLGDGEMQEGQVWEALMFAAHYRLDNMCVIIDHNGLQIDGTNEKVMGLGSIPDKLRAFGLNVFQIDGHDFQAMEKAFDAARQIKGKPSAIVLETTKGKGVSYMEGQVGWHGKAPNDEEYARGMAELSAQLAELEAV